MIFLAISVHYRIREMDHQDARTLYPTKSAITFWQVEDARDIVNGKEERGRGKEIEGRGGQGEGG